MPCAGVVAVALSVSFSTRVVFLFLLAGPSFWRKFSRDKRGGLGSNQGSPAVSAVSAVESQTAKRNKTGSNSTITDPNRTPRHREMTHQILKCWKFIRFGVFRPRCAPERPASKSGPLPLFWRRRHRHRYTCRFFLFSLSPVSHTFCLVRNIHVVLETVQRNLEFPSSPRKKAHALFRLLRVLDRTRIQLAKTKRKDKINSIVPTSIFEYLQMT